MARAQDRNAPPHAKKNCCHSQIFSCNVSLPCPPFLTFRSSPLALKCLSAACEASMAGGWGRTPAASRDMCTKQTAWLQVSLHGLAFPPAQTWNPSAPSALLQPCHAATQPSALFCIFCESLFTRYSDILRDFAG